MKVLARFFACLFFSLCLMFFFNASELTNAIAGVPCTAPDNGSGTANIPASCPYTNPSGTIDIINGLAVGDQLNSQGTFDSFFDITYSVGGSLGGAIEQFKGLLTLVMSGTGSLSGFNRTIPMDMQCVTHSAPRTSGNPVQSFDTDMFQLQGQVTGDPDFDLLRITAGTGFGLPSPGHTTLTQLPGGDWNVDSFFDITYRIDFVGAPGGTLAGRSGSTTATIRMQQGMPVALGRICVRKYFDRNHNQQLDPSEQPMGGVTFGILDP
ncbi:MAG TPA: hypothetical protein VFF29_06960, partial [Bacteroidota bacterium]|nr:hypothetical protein [Bacteroidota bacterium]